MIQATNRKYLRYIYQLLLEGKKVRQIDLALSLGYARSSVSIAISEAVALKSGAVYFVGQALMICQEAAGDCVSFNSVIVSVLRSIAH